MNTEPLAIERKRFMHDGGPIGLSIPVKHLENFSEPWTRLSALFWLRLRRAVPNLARTGGHTTSGRLASPLSPQSDHLLAGRLWVQAQINQGFCCRQEKIPNPELPPRRIEHLSMKFPIRLAFPNDHRPAKALEIAPFEGTAQIYEFTPSEEIFAISVDRKILVRRIP